MQDTSYHHVSFRDCAPVHVQLLWRDVTFCYDSANKENQVKKKKKSETKENTGCTQRFTPTTKLSGTMKAKY